jgi:hypothetical protein
VICRSNAAIRSSNSRANSGQARPPVRRVLKQRHAVRKAATGVAAQPRMRSNVAVVCSCVCGVTPAPGARPAEASCLTHSTSRLRTFKQWLAMARLGAARVVDFDTDEALGSGSLCIEQNRYPVPARAMMGNAKAG